MNGPKESLAEGLAAHRAGRLDVAASVYDRILAGDPDNAEALHLKGVLVRDRGDAAAAVTLLKRAADLDPASPVIRHNLAGALLATGQPEAAVLSYREALRLAPRFAEAQLALGTTLIVAGQAREAVTALERAGMMMPESPEPALYRAEALRLLSRFREAVEACREAVERAPDLAEARFSLGNAHLSALEHEAAIAAYRAAIERDPGHAGAWCNMGNALRDLRRVVEAGDCYRRAVEIAPGMAEAHSNLGIALKDRGRMDETVSCFRRALAIDPALHETRSNLLFCLSFKEDEAPEDVYREHLAFERLHAAPLARLARPHDNAPDPERRLNVAYLSPDFRIHPGGHYNLPVVERLDREKFTMTCYYSYTKTDAWTAKFRAAADRWREVVGWSDERLADQIRADGIDILVECAGHMAGNRLLALARKPAPIQITHQLYPNTTGLSAIDYRLMDDHIAPPGMGATHSETIIRLPRCHVCYRPLDVDVAPAQALPADTSGHITFGSFNNIIKLGRDSIAAWARILQAVPEARLRMKWLELDRGSREWWLDAFADAGADPARIELLGWTEDPYSPYREIDICLDPLFANGGTTTCDALWMGVPVVTRVGQQPFARVGLCHLTNMGMGDLIADSPDAYVETAVALATDRPRLRAMRTGLRERFRASPIMDEAGYVRHLETAFRAVWRDWCAGHTTR